ncbi:MAG: chemotaxis protein CheW [Burkholderiaceae bacterium]
MDAPHQHGIEILAFTLGGEEYGADIRKVWEIRGQDAITHIAGAPDFIKGVINLRGSIVPILDMRARFRVADDVDQRCEVALMLQMRERVIGMLVDGVSDVLRLEAAQIRPAPRMNFGWNQDCLRGFGLIGQRLLALLDFESLLSDEDFGLLEKLAA